MFRIGTTDNTDNTDDTDGLIRVIRVIRGSEVLLPVSGARAFRNKL
jgi:hypothetical protein